MALTNRSQVRHRFCIRLHSYKHSLRTLPCFLNRTVLPAPHVRKSQLTFTRQIVLSSKLSPRKVVYMPIEITFCALCTRSRPEFLDIVDQLRYEYPDDLCIVTLNCMAACDDVPAVMINIDYRPRITPDDLYNTIKAQIATKAVSEVS